MNGLPLSRPRPSPGRALGASVSCRDRRAELRGHCEGHGRAHETSATSSLESRTHSPHAPGPAHRTGYGEVRSRTGPVAHAETGLWLAHQLMPRGGGDNPAPRGLAGLTPAGEVPRSLAQTTSEAAWRRAREHGPQTLTSGFTCFQKVPFSSQKWKSRLVLSSAHCPFPHRLAGVY